jgi:hypothetical protein
MDGKEPQSTTPKRLPKWAKAFFKSLRVTGVVLYACKAAKCDRRNAYHQKDNNPTFAALWSEAMEEAADRLEKEARRRAEKGCLRKVFHKGIPVIDPETGEQYVEYEYSDVLTIFLLKGARPEKYRDNIAIEQTGSERIVTETVIYARDDPANPALSPPHQPIPEVLPGQ